MNTGDSFSKLHWEIIQQPNWGTWSFNVKEGYLFKEEGTFQLNISVITPNQKNNDYVGSIKIINQNNPEDNVTIELSLKTTKKINSHLYDFLEKHPLISHLLAYIHFR